MDGEAQLARGKSNIAAEQGNMQNVTHAQRRRSAVPGCILMSRLSSTCLLMASNQAAPHDL